MSGRLNAEAGPYRQARQRTNLGDWQAWMAEEVPFIADQRSWERADVVTCGTPEISLDPDTEVVVASSRTCG
jgi:hypothetical protein